MELMIWVGAGLSVLGLVGIIACIVAVARAKRAALPEEALRARLQQAVAWNLGALMTSALGLGLVAAGILLS